jgi:hypothetical protein
MRKFATNYFDIKLFLFSFIIFTQLGLSQTTIFSENFDGTFPNSWFIGNDGGISTLKWGINSYRKASGTYSGFCAANGTSSNTYPNSLSTYMERRNISLSGYTNATLTFKYYLNTEATNDKFTINIRLQDGSWVTPMNVSGNQSASGWQTKSIDLSSYCGQTGLFIQFRFDSNTSITSEGVWVDDISLTASTTVRTLTVTGNLTFTVNVSPNDNNGLGSGQVSITRSYYNSTVVTLTAPSSVVGAGFHHWEKNGVQVSTSVSYQITMDNNYTVNAVYARNMQITGKVALASGTGVSGVSITFSGYASPAITDANGNYIQSVSYGWTGTATPSLTSYTFSPTSKSYTNVVLDKSGENYTATTNTYIISGKVNMNNWPNNGVSGFVVRATNTVSPDATYNSPVSGTDGSYIISNVLNGSYNLSVVNTADYTTTVTNPLTVSNANVTGKSITLEGRATAQVRIVGPSSFITGQPFDVTVYLKNISNIVNTLTGYLDISFPDNPNVVVKSHTFSSQSIYDPGQNIYPAIGNPFPATDRLVEAVWSGSIGNNEERQIVLTITPSISTTNLNIRYRGIIFDKYDPTSSSAPNTTDQQGWPTKVLTIPAISLPNIIVKANRVDLTGGNHLTISKEAFIRGRYDRLATISDQDQFNSCLKYMREGLWVKLTIKNPTSQTQIGTIQTKVKYPDGTERIIDPDHSIWGLNGWALVLTAGQSKDINIPVYPDNGTLDPFSDVIDGEYKIFFKFKEDFPTLPDLVVQVNSNELQHPVRDTLGQSADFNFSEYLTPPTTIEYFNHVIDFCNIAIALFGNGGAKDPIDYLDNFDNLFGDIREAMINAANSQVELISQSQNQTSIMTKWQNRTFYPDGNSGPQKMLFDRVTATIDIKVPSASPFAQISNPELSNSIRNYTDSDGNKHTTAVWWIYGVDRQIIWNQSNQWNTKSISITHTSDIEVNFAVMFEFGPYNGKPSVDEDGAIINYNKWITSPQDVYWVRVSADQSNLIASGTGIQSITYNNLSLNNWGDISVNVIAPSDGIYYVKIFGGNLLPPNWEWQYTSSNSVSLIGGQSIPFLFSVKPNTSDEIFQFWLYKQSWIPGIYFVSNKVTVDISAPLPIELFSFKSQVTFNIITVFWETKTEYNSEKFEIERKSLTTEWSKIASIAASGNSNVAKQYSYKDRELNSGKYCYRLKMIDNDGRFKYSKILETEVAIPKNFELSQNYPNPFNPSTKIDYQLPVDTKVLLEIYNITGQKVVELVNKVQTAGYYSVDFNSFSLGKNITSGIYFYRIIGEDKTTGNEFSTIKKMMLLK